MRPMGIPGLAVTGYLTVKELKPPNRSFTGVFIQLLRTDYTPYGFERVEVTSEGQVFYVLKDKKLPYHEKSGGILLFPTRKDALEFLILLQFN